MAVNPDYPGIDEKTDDLRKAFSHLTRQQAYVMAAVEIRPDRNADARFVGWDRKKRPVFEEDSFGKPRRFATQKNGNPTEPDGEVLVEVPS